MGGILFASRLMDRVDNRFPQLHIDALEPRSEEKHQPRAFRTPAGKLAETASSNSGITMSGSSKLRLLIVQLALLMRNFLKLSASVFQYGQCGPEIEGKNFS